MCVCERVCVCLCVCVCVYLVHFVEGKLVIPHLTNHDFALLSSVELDNVGTQTSASIDIVPKVLRVNDGDSVRHHTLSLIIDLELPLVQWAVHIAPVAGIDLDMTASTSTRVRGLPSNRLDTGPNIGVVMVEGRAVVHLELELIAGVPIFGSAASVQAAHRKCCRIMNEIAHTCNSRRDVADHSLTLAPASLQQRPGRT